MPFKGITIKSIVWWAFPTKPLVSAYLYLYTNTVYKLDWNTPAPPNPAFKFEHLVEYNSGGLTLVVDTRPEENFIFQENKGAKTFKLKDLPLQAPGKDVLWRDKDGFLRIS